MSRLVRRNVFHVQLFCCLSGICGQYYFCCQQMFSGSRSPLKAFCSTAAEVKLNQNRNDCIRLLVFHACNPLILFTLMHGSADVKIQFNSTRLIYSSDFGLRDLETIFHSNARINSHNRGFVLYRFAREQPLISKTFSWKIQKLC